MTPGARVEAAIAILDEILAGVPAEQALTGWARKSRFAGSKDRAVVRDHVFQALRCRRSYACKGGAATGRGLMIGAVREAGDCHDDVFTGAQYAPAPLSVAECASGATPTSDGDRLDLPDWLVAYFRNSLGEDTEQTALALRERGPIMLRVNVRKASLAQATEALALDGVLVEPDGIAHSALRVIEGARRIAGSDAYRNGWVELQDGSSQAAMAALPIESGSRVLDYCAGGGGKVLALAARCSADWFAYDAYARRMKDLPTRAHRAGVQVEILSSPQVAQQAPFDLVLCDAPCSGSGTWRRTPDAKWRLTEDRLQELMTTQRGILETAAQSVGKAGILAYSTCSILAEENSKQIEDFLARERGWKLETEKRYAISGHGDGFYLAMLRRD